MKITFISQKPDNIIDRNHPNMRVDLAQQCILKAPNIHYSNISRINEKFDVAILLIPKTEQDRNQLYEIDVVNESRKIANKVWFMQEGPSWIFQDLPLHQQFWHYNVLSNVDGILCENETDISYFKGLLIDKDIPVWDIPSVMVEDIITPYKNTIRENKVMIGGNFCRWYGGFDSYIIAHIFDSPIYAPSMGRKIENEENIQNLNHLPYMQWRDWIQTLSSFKYAVHLMPTIAAGTFAMNCGFLGIPCIGYEDADTQRIIHPELSIKQGDLNKAKELALKLKTDTKFYNKCSADAIKNYNEHFSESKFLDKMYKRLQSC
mgnify:CR=1 FL=1|jgi:hypothetical protein